MTIVKSNQTIPDSNIDAFRAKMEKLNKKALKSGNPPFVLDVVGTEMREVSQYIHDEEYTFPMLHYHVEVSGVLPVIEEGYRFAGVIERVNEKNLVYCANPSLVKRIPEMRSRPQDCDHCQTKRKRNRVYILENPDGKLIQVGKTCMGDFLVEKSAQYLANYYSTVKDIYEEATRVPSQAGVGHIFFKTTDILQVVCNVVETDGEFKGVAYGAEATAAKVKKLMMNKYHSTIKKENSHMYTYDRGTITKIAQTIINATNKNEYLENMTTLLTEEYIRYKDINFLASITTGYSRLIQQEKEKQEKLKAKEESKLSNYVGEEGQRLDLELLYDDLYWFETNYGLKYVYKFKDKDGNIFTWFTTTGADIDKGTLYKVKGTVKEHTEYRDEKQTILTRCNFKPKEGTT